MVLIAGTRLGPYEILGSIGAGGMGQVYRANDTRLQRIVAIKILAPHLADDAEARARFEREARAVSSLSHPHICTLFDIGHEPATLDGSTRAVQFLVMEHLEGETLEARLAKGPLPIEQALRFAIEIGEALACAHRRGITHRDLKPGNVFLAGSRDRATVKLLDFGLAKPQVPVTGVAGPELRSGDVPPTMVTALAGPLTSKGAFLGTVQYMAPEQLEGREADARTDIWAFGCLLYEMLTGTRPFTGSSPASLIAAILEREPVLPQREPAALPARVWDVIRTCLAKDPDDRWQSARDLVRYLRWSGEGEANPSNAATPGATVPRRVWILAASIALAGTLGASAWLFRGSADATPAGPPVVVLMDSTHPERIYDDATRKAGGTNADDLTDLLRDLPVRLLKENTGMTWHREHEVLQLQPALIVAHRSSFYDATILGEASAQMPFINLSWDKFELFAGYVGQSNPRTRILAYSRGSWSDETQRAQWVARMEQRFPPLRGRIDALRVPLERATFRHPVTGAEIRKRIIHMLALERQ